MAASIDDLLTALEKINRSVEDLATSQKQHTQRYKNRSLNRNTTGPRQRWRMGLRDLLRGRNPMKQWGKGVKEWMKQKGFSKLGGLGKVMAVASVIDQFRKALIRATEAAVNAARKYAEVSGSMAVAVAQRDIREMIREMEKGNRVASSADTMMGAEQFRKDQHKEIDILGDRVQNYLVAAGNAVAGTLLIPLEVMATGFNELLDIVSVLAKVARDKPEPANLSDWAEDAAKRGNEVIEKQRRIFDQLAKDAERMRPK